jgi:hypothetical protein
MTTSREPVACSRLRNDFLFLVMQKASLASMGRTEAAIYLCPNQNLADPLLI